MKKFIPVLMLVCVLFSNCSSDDQNNSSKLSKRVGAKNFTLNTPKDWKLTEDQGYDTYIGRITNGDKTIFFDQGSLSFGNLGNIKKTEETIYFKRLKIHGVPAIIQKEKRPDNSSVNTRLTVYLDNGTKQNRLYALDSKNDDLFIKIFKTHQFL